NSGRGRSSRGCTATAQDVPVVLTVLGLWLHFHDELSDAVVRELLTAAAHDLEHLRRRGTPRHRWHGSPSAAEPGGRAGRPHPGASAECPGPLCSSGSAGDRTRRLPPPGPERPFGGCGRLGACPPGTGGGHRENGSGQTWSEPLTISAHNRS